MPSCCSPNYFAIVCPIPFFGTRSLYLPLFILVAVRSFRTWKTFDIQLWRENPYSLRFKLRLHSHSEVLVAIGNALRFIHQEGVLHRDVWSSKDYQRLHLHTEVACFFLWKLPQTLTDPNEPIKTLRKKDKQQPEKTHTQKNTKNKKQSKKRTHTHIHNEYQQKNHVQNFSRFQVKPGNLLLSRKGLQDPSPMEVAWAKP